jgi:hypothetical protein
MKGNRPRIARFMRTLHLVGFMFFLAGCSTSKRQEPTLSANQADALALKLANDKALIIYNWQIFQAARTARFAQGHWKWIQRQGFGHCDLEATVKLAPDGSTNAVDVNLLDNQNRVVF